MEEEQVLPDRIETYLNIDLKITSRGMMGKNAILDIQKKSPDALIIERNIQRTNEDNFSILDLQEAH